MKLIRKRLITRNKMVDSFTPQYQKNCQMYNETFRGCPYSVWIQKWSRWFVSAFPSYNPPDDILFLRGSLETNYGQGNLIQNVYEYDYKTRNKVTGQPELKTDIQRSTEIRPLYNRVGLKDGSKLGEIISRGTAILCPIMTALYWEGSEYEGRVLETDEDLRYAAKKDTDESREIWALIRKLEPKSESQIRGQKKNPAFTIDEVLHRNFKVGEWQRLVENLINYRFESDIFTITISDKNPYINMLQMVPGKYNAVIEGYFVLIKSLDLGTYQLHLGGRGRGGYQTDSIYEITVTNEFVRRNLVIDISGKEPVVTPLPPPYRPEYSYSDAPPSDLESII